MSTEQKITEVDHLDYDYKSPISQYERDFFAAAWTSYDDSGYRVEGGGWATDDKPPTHEERVLIAFAKAKLSAAERDKAAAEAEIVERGLEIEHWKSETQNYYQTAQKTHDDLVEVTVKRDDQIKLTEDALAEVRALRSKLAESEKHMKDLTDRAEKKEQEEVLSFANALFGGSPSVKPSSLRDQFAMAALTGLLAVHSSNSGADVYGRKLASQYAYQYADAMLETRKLK